MSDGPPTDADPVEPTVVDAVRERLRPFPEPDAGTFGDRETRDAFADVFDAALHDPTVIGLGEATHGTHEFFRFKARLFRYLVERRDHQLLCLEVEFTAGLALDEYVRGAVDRPAPRVVDDSEILGNWQCEAVADLLEWLRAFNEGRDREEQVAVHGIDAQRQRLPATALVAYLDRVDTEPPAGVREALDVLNCRPYMQLDEGEREPYRAACRTVADDLGGHLEANEAVYAEETSRRAVRRARQQCRNVGQAGALAAAEAAGGQDAYVRAREEAMARNVPWLLDHEAADRGAVWAHNSHVGRGPLYGHADGSIRALGDRLAEEFGDGYDALGLTTASGHVRIYSLPDEAFRTPSIPEPPAGSLPAALGRTGTSPFFLDPQEAAAEPPVADWFTDCPRRHMVGGAYEDSPETYVAGDPRDAFDGLVFLGPTTAARAVDT